MTNPSWEGFREVMTLDNQGIHGEAFFIGPKKMLFNTYEKEIEAYVVKQDDFSLTLKFEGAPRRIRARDSKNVYITSTGCTLTSHKNGKTSISFFLDDTVVTKAETFNYQHYEDVLDEFGIRILED